MYVICRLTGESTYGYRRRLPCVTDPCRYPKSRTRRWLAVDCHATVEHDRTTQTDYGPWTPSATRNRRVSWCNCGRRQMCRRCRCRRCRRCRWCRCKRGHRCWRMRRIRRRRERSRRSNGRRRERCLRRHRGQRCRRSCCGRWCHRGSSRRRNRSPGGRRGPSRRRRPRRKPSMRRQRRIRRQWRQCRNRHCHRRRNYAHSRRRRRNNHDLKRNRRLRRIKCRSRSSRRCHLRCRRRRNRRHLDGVASNHSGKRQRQASDQNHPQSVGFREVINHSNVDSMLLTRLTPQNNHHQISPLLKSPQSAVQTSPTYPNAARTNNPERVSPSRLAASSTMASTRSGSVIFTLTRLPDNFDTSASTSAHTPSA